MNCNSVSLLTSDPEVSSETLLQWTDPVLSEMTAFCLKEPEVRLHYEISGDDLVYDLDIIKHVCQGDCWCETVSLENVFFQIPRKFVNQELN